MGRFCALVCLVALAGCWRMGIEAPITTDAPATADALRIRPNGAWLSIAIPSWDDWRGRFMHIASAYAGDSFDGAAWEANECRRWSTRLGLPETDTISQLARALHLKPDTVIGLYVEPTEEDSAYPDFAVAIQTDNASESESLVRTALFGTDSDAAQAKNDEGIDIWSVEGRDGAYCVADPWMVIGSSSMLVWEIATRVAEASPASVAYGTPSCPVERPDELVALVQMDRVSALAPLFDRIFDTNGEPAREHPFLARLAERHSPADPDAVPEPAVVTIRNDDEGLSLLYRIDTAAFPALADDAPEPAPLRLAALLPPSSEAIAGIRFNRDDLARFTDVWLGLVPEALRNDSLYKMAENQLLRSFDVLDDEVAIGMLGIASDQPALMAFATLRDPEAAQAIFGAFSPLFKAVRTYDGAAIYGLPAQMGFPLSYATAGNTLVIGPGPDMVEGALAQLEQNAPSGLFQTLEPPVDPAAPCGTLVVVPQKLLRDLALPLAKDALSPNAYRQIDSFLAHFREVRFVQQPSRQWSSTRLSLLPIDGAAFTANEDYGSLTTDSQ